MAPSILLGTKGYSLLFIRCMWGNQVLSRILSAQTSFWSKLPQVWHEISYWTINSYPSNFCPSGTIYTSLRIVSKKEIKIIYYPLRKKKNWWLSLAPAAATATKSLQPCPTLWDPIDGSPSGSPVPGILQARTLEWVAISFSNAWKWKVKVKLLSRIRPLATPRTAAHQAPLSMVFSRQEYWSGVPLPSPTEDYREILSKKKE